MMNRCDTLLMIGTTFPYAEFLPKDGQARTVQIDLSSRNVGMRYPTEVNLIGDSAETLRRLIPLLKRTADRSWRDSIEKRVATWWEDSEARAMASADPINRSEEHTSELQSLMRNSYAVFCLKKKTIPHTG